MKYLVKDLSRLTGLSPARIRKWQERYGLLDPEVGSNGYHYYSSDDLFILQRINRELEKGEALARIVQKGRDEILTGRLNNGFNDADRQWISLISKGDFSSLAERFDAERRDSGLSVTLRGPVHDLICLVGDAWETGYLGVADEHAFTRWLSGYLAHLTEPVRGTTPYQWLVVTHPEDVHELGALLHYCDLAGRGVAVRFCGNLPERDLLRELAGRSYRKLSISVVMPRQERELMSLKKRIKTRFPNLSVLFGGEGYRRRVRD